ncbi:MAG: glycogen debranching protein [Methanothrix sp.]|nr:glycogen debranching protein [Methanothrix sp.]
MTSFHSYQEATAREWLVGNGLGGYASSTLCGSNTRAYHGLLVAALQPPKDRWLLLSFLDEEIDGHHLASHQYPGAIYPQGYRYIKEFRQDPFPRICYEVGKARVEKTVFMIRGENTTIVRYRITGGEGRFSIVPLMHSRSFHAARPLPLLQQKRLAGGAMISSSERPDAPLMLLSDGPDFRAEERVYNNFEYEAERSRGLAWKEDLFSPGRFQMDLSGDEEFAIAASAWRSSMPDWRREMARERSRLEALMAPLPELSAAADSFLVRRGGSLSIIAGYHWFDDWGRDAMISLPGLLLSTGRTEEAESVLRLFASAMKGGVLPNDLGAESYNTVDASLWFVRAVAAYFELCGDMPLLEELWPALLAIYSRYSRAGEGFGADEDGLIFSDAALTWMDARVDGRPVTGRAGKCCEINALWYSALKDMNKLQKALGRNGRPGGADFSRLARKVKASFRRFWNSETGCLYDVLDHEDASIRPNQIIAAGIEGLLPDVMRQSVLETVTRELLTPYGLRTLSPRDPRYAGWYEGGPASRDGAYHQGTVWPWLIGPYIDALISIKGRSKAVRSQARELLQPLLSLAAGMGTLPEVFDGNSPHRPGGCISQAWSVAEVLRAWKKIE